MKIWISVQRRMKKVTEEFKFNLIPFYKIELLITNQPKDFLGYRVFPDGKVWSKRGDWPLKVQWKKGRNGNVYMYYNLYHNKKAFKLYVHRLIADVFLGSVAGYEIDHINRDTTDNKVTNLEIVTRVENDKRWREIESRKKIGGLINY